MPGQQENEEIARLDWACKLTEQSLCAVSLQFAFHLVISKAFTDQNSDKFNFKIKYKLVLSTESAYLFPRSLVFS